MVCIPAPSEGATVALNVAGDDNSVHQEGPVRAIWAKRLLVPHLAVSKAKRRLLETVLGIRTIQTQAVLVTAAVAHRHIPCDLYNVAGFPTRLSFAGSFQKRCSGHLVRIAIGLPGSGHPRVEASRAISACPWFITRLIALTAWQAITRVGGLVSFAHVPIANLITTQNGTRSWRRKPAMAECAGDQRWHNERDRKSVV